MNKQFYYIRYSKMIKTFAYFTIRFLNNIIRKNDRYLIFTSSPNYTDNAFAVFDYLYNNYKNQFSFIWLLQDSNAIERYPDVRYHSRHSILGLYYFFRSKYVFHTHGLYLNAVSDKQVIFSLWHGMPLKNIQHLFPRDLDRIANRRFRFDYTVATSELMQKILMKCFCCTQNQVKLTGLPRNDNLFNRYKFKNIPDSSKIIVWMPTYRKGNGLMEGSQYEYGVPIINSNNIGEINDLCEKNNLYIIVKMHPFQEKSKDIQKYSNILLVSKVTDNKSHFYNYLGSADALITDYSSVYIDFLAVDKPIAFILEDYDSYNDDRGFVFDNPLKYMPGSHIYNMNDLKEFILEIVNEIDSTKKLRDTVGMQLNKFRDNKNTERFISEILPVLLKDKK